MMIRIFKQSSELEVWKQTGDGSFGLLKTYAICKWSGNLGPKFAEGDRQAPEGFYNRDRRPDESEVRTLSVLPDCRRL